jgi:excisionase family DNA binding protein
MTPATPFDALPEYLTVPELASYLRISRNNAYALVSRGAIPSVRFGRLVRVPKTALRATDLEGALQSAPATPRR